MNCERTEDLFSELYDGSLPERREQALRAHLDACSRCRAAWSEFGTALEALRATGTTPGTTSASSRLRTAILSAVDAAAEADAQSSEASFERATILAAARLGRRERRRVTLVGVASMAAGLAAGFVLFFGSGPGATSSGTPPARAATGPANAIASAVDVREPVLVREPEVAPNPLVYFVSVPTVVEHFVTVPEVVEVERVVRRGPLIAVDLAPLERVGTALLASMDQWRGETEVWMADLVRQAATPAAPSIEERAMDPRKPSRPALAVRPSRERPTLASSVAVRRIDDEVSLETRGPLAAVVPLLVAQLDDEDPRVRGLVARRLESIRAELASDPVLGPRLLDVPERVAAERGVFERWFDDTPDPARDPGERWSEWRSVNRELLVAAGPAPHSERGGL